MQKWRDDCLIAGIREAEFWDMTIGEASRACNAFNEQRKDRAYFAYTNAMATGLFIGSMFSSKSAPTINDIFPELFPKEEQSEAEREIRMERSAANFLKFANSFNQRYKPNGDRELKSENNG